MAIATRGVDPVVVVWLRVVLVVAGEPSSQLVVRQRSHSVVQLVVYVRFVVYPDRACSHCEVG